MRQYTGAHPDWLTVVQLPAYAPELNPAEGVWANMKNGLGNLAACTVDQLAGIARNRLRHIQHQPGLISGFLAQTGLRPRPVRPANLRSSPGGLCREVRCWPYMAPVPAVRKRMLLDAGTAARAEKIIELGPRGGEPAGGREPPPSRGLRWTDVEPGDHDNAGLRVQLAAAFQ